jgi:hypothetical protein
VIIAKLIPWLAVLFVSATLKVVVAPAAAERGVMTAEYLDDAIAADAVAASVAHTVTKLTATPRPHLV